jgi:EAL domain-containing protein (putative c-di-GMP-specific phosphodiesterase class I)
MRLLGVRISIDDFGTGYSSMSSLAVLPTDTLKIDSSFVRDCAHDAKARSVAAAIVSLAHTLGKQTVAEGVETLEQLDALRRLGCDCVQGYLLGRPVPMAALKHLPAEEKRWAEAIAKTDDRISRLAG